MFQLICLILFATSAMAIDSDAVTELRSSDLTPTVDMTWFASNPVFYYPIMDLLDVWAFARDALGETFANSRSAAEIVKLGCNTWRPPTTTTFFGVDVQFDVVITNEEVVYRKQGTLDPWRRFRYEFTDNKSFVLGTNSFDNGEGAAGWILLANTPTLPKHTETKIRNRLLSLGFSMQNVIRPPNAEICNAKASYAANYAY